MGLFDNFPYTNFHELNLDWILQMLQKIDKTMDEFVAINALKYADPIQWNIVRQYEKNTIVIDPLSGTAYISVQPVPSGVIITNTDYWTVVFDLGAFVVRASKNFAAKYEDATTLTATFPSSVNDWLIWGDVLYKVISPIVSGDQYVVDSNIQHFTMEDVIGHLEDLNTTDKSNLVAAINEVIQSIGDLADLNTTDKSSIVAAINENVNNIGDLDNLVTTDKSSIVNAINDEVIARKLVESNIKIVNVLDYGAVGDGVTDDTQAITDAIATGNIVYFPVGSYAVASLPNSNANFIGWGVLVLPNTHTVPVHDADSATLYDTDFLSLASLISWLNNMRLNTVSIYCNNAITSFTMSSLKRADKIKVHLYPLSTVEHIVADTGNLTIHAANWAETTEVSHLLVMNHAICTITDGETVEHKAAYFHYWVIDATLILTGLAISVNSGCQFSFFLYAERNSYVNAESLTWTGTTGTCWGASIIENSYCEAPVYNYASYNTYFPSSHSNLPNVNSRDYVLSALAVGGRIGNMPDYGWKPFFGESGYDLSGQTVMEADDIPDQYTMLTILARDVVCNGGNLYIQIRRMFENNWDVNVGDYIGADQQLPVTPYQKPVTGATVDITGALVNVGGVDYPVTGGPYNLTGGVVSVNSETFELEDFSVSAISFGAGNNPIEVQLTFIQYNGISRPMYIGYVLDGAGTKHYITGVCKAGRIASIRLLSSQAITSGNGNILMSF